MDPFLAALLRGSLDPPSTQAASAQQHASHIASRPGESTAAMGIPDESGANVLAPPAVERQGPIPAQAAGAGAAASGSAGHQEAVQSPKPRLSLAEQMRRYGKA